MGMGLHFSSPLYFSHVMMSRRFSRCHHSSLSIYTRGFKTLVSQSRSPQTHILPHHLRSFYEPGINRFSFLLSFVAVVLCGSSSRKLTIR